MEDPNAQAQAFASQQRQMASGSRPSHASAPRAAEEADAGDEDATGLDANDIKIVMEQGNVSRTKAIQTLRKSKGDIVSAIMELSL